MRFLRVPENLMRLLDWPPNKPVTGAVVLPDGAADPLPAIARELIQDRAMRIVASAGDEFRFEARRFRNLVRRHVTMRAPALRDPLADRSEADPLARWRALHPPA